MRLLSILVIGMVTSGPVSAYQLSSPRPQSYEEIQQEIQAISADLEQAESGGWDETLEVGAVPGIGRIARVEGVPGWDGAPLGNPASGMAARIEQGGRLNDGYQFPDDATGFATTCALGGTVTRGVWEDGVENEPGEYVQQDILAPLHTDDPPCAWRPDGLAEGPHTPERCEEFCTALNQYTYHDCRIFEYVWADGDGEIIGVFPEGEEPEETESESETDATIIGRRCAPDGWDEKYTCSETWVIPDPGRIARKNCEPCDGDQCRCPGPGCMTIAAEEESDNPPQPSSERKTYQSFFRAYRVLSARAGIPQVPSDQLKNVEADVACYGVYQEFDPLEETVGGRRMCVIRFPYSRRNQNPFAESTTGLAESQQGKGEYMAESDEEFPTDDPLLFPSTHDLDLSSAFLALNQATIQTTRPNADALARWPRPPSDAVSGERGSDQPLTRWWNAFASDMHRLITPPTVRLRLPDTLASVLRSLPIDPANPAIRQPLTSTRSIDVELRAGPDMIDVLSQALRQILQPQIETIPVVVPDGDPLQYRQLAQTWKDYAQQLRARTATANTIDPSVPEQIQTLITQLETYARQIERERALRAELPRTLSILLQRQREILVGIQSWENDQLDRYRSHLQAQRARLQFAPKVREIQSLATTAAAANMPWSRLDAFTTPLYSLLDPWMPGRPDLGGGVPDCDGDDGLPILCLPRERELLIDLSLFTLPRTKTIFPVFRRVPVAWRLPTPPDPGEPPPSPESLSLPSFPPVPTLSDDVLSSLPTVERRGPDPIGVDDPPSLDLEQIDRQLDRAATIVRGMAKTYEEFWASIEPSEQTQALACPGRNTPPCVFTEMELRQTVQRVVARPFVLGQEDLTLRENSGIQSVLCDPSDRACMDLPGQRQMPATGWQIVTPSNEDPVSLRTLRQKAREQTIGPNGQLQKDPRTSIPFPYITPAEKLYPAYAVPRDIELIPPSP